MTFWLHGTPLNLKMSHFVFDISIANSPLSGSRRSTFSSYGQAEKVLRHNVSKKRGPKNIQCTCTTDMLSNLALQKHKPSKGEPYAWQGRGIPTRRCAIFVGKSYFQHIKLFVHGTSNPGRKRSKHFYRPRVWQTSLRNI